MAAFAFVASTDHSIDASGTTLDCPETLDIQAGDLLVGIARWYGGTSTVTLAEDDGGNAFTLLDVVVNSTAKLYVRFGYKIAASASAAATMRLTLGTSREYRSAAFLQFRPSGTVVVDQSNKGATGNSTTIQSGAITTTGNDGLIIGALSSGLWRTFSSIQIAGAAADGSLIAGTDGGDQLVACYSIFEVKKTDVFARCTINSTGQWAADILSFIVEAAGTTLTVKAMLSMDQFGGGALCAQ